MREGKLIGLYKSSDYGQLLAVDSTSDASHRRLPSDFIVASAAAWIKQLGFGSDFEPN